MIVDPQTRELIGAFLAKQRRDWSWLAYRIRIYTGRPMDLGRLHRIIHAHPSHYLTVPMQEAIADALGAPEAVLFRGDGHEPA